ncbi:ABC-type dipeptide transport system periplasmic component [Gardnerella vaginalis 1500E]|uniref:ABC-type dipeptide transport system periplasmic component n=1 Tax=Gardnerella vaginalis 1500E TaxID=698957 RepID=I4M3J0_GARVA|nr:ABC transporter substrate-binding protein [Gardnerella vaginalis]EIK83780.1 ABC-type dipeptide transport system periplasmic component [Gardnerella vaginalis 1500E]
MGNAKPEEGVHEENGATEKFSGEFYATNSYDNASAGSASADNASKSSTDDSLNAAAKSNTSSKNRKLSKPWLFTIVIVAIVVISAIFATVTDPSLFKSQNAVSTMSHKTVTIGLKLSPTNLDIRNQSGSSLDQLLIGNVYEGLVARNEKNQVSPSLAKRWEVSKDGLRYTFYLRKDSVFSNGHKLTAKDAAWSFNELVSKQYRGSNMVGKVESAKAKDDYTFEITLKEPNAKLLWALCSRAGLVFDKTAKYDAKTQAVGSGPYLIEKFVPSDRVVLKANPRYKGIHPAKTEKVVVRYFVDDNAAVDALSSGAVKALAPISGQLAKPFKDDSKRYVVRAGNGTDKFVLAMNMNGEHTKDARVRKAIRYAIDHKQIIASRGGTDLALGGPIPSLDPGYEDLTKLYPHNIDRAKSLMKDAGFDKSHPLKLSLTYPNIYGTQLGDQLRSQLEAVGVDLRVNVVEFTTWLQDVYKNKQYDLSMVDHNESHDFGQWADPTYYYGYDNKQVQDLYAKAMLCANENESYELLKKAARIISKDAPADWLFNYRVVTAKVKNLEGMPFDMNQEILPLYNLRLVK